MICPTAQTNCKHLGNEAVLNMKDGPLLAWVQCSSVLGVSPHPHAPWRLGGVSRYCRKMLSVGRHEIALITHHVPLVRTSFIFSFEVGL